MKAQAEKYVRTPKRLERDLTSEGFVMGLGNALLISVTSALSLVSLLAAGAFITFFAMFVVEIAESAGKSLLKSRGTMWRRVHRLME